MNDMSRPSFRALVVGWYGAPNVGDELLLEILKTSIEARGGAITVASVDPALTRAMHGVDSVDFHNVGELARALLWADILIMGGGGIFQDHHPFHIHAVYDPVLNDISAYARPILMARQFGVPVVIWGHGVGPLAGTEARELVQDIFNNANAVSIRDDKSLGLLREIGVDRPIDLGADPGWLYKQCCMRGTALQGVASQGKKTLAVVIREWRGGHGAWRQRLVSALELLINEDWQVKWVAFQANTRVSGATSDLSLLEEIRANLPEHVKGEIFLPSTPREAWDLLASADAIFSMRLHASIMGLLARRPLVGLEYDDKMTQAHAMAGLPADQCLRLEDSQERFVEALRAAMGYAGVPWVTDVATIRRLEDSASVHLALLDGVHAYVPGKKHWVGGRFDWLATWLQQTLADLRETKERSRAAHELLQYRDYMLSERDANLESLRGALKDLQEMTDLANQRAEILAAQDISSNNAIKELQLKVAGLDEQLAASQAEALRLFEEVAQKNEELVRLSVRWGRVQDAVAEMLIGFGGRSNGTDSTAGSLEIENMQGQRQQDTLASPESISLGGANGIEDLDGQLRTLRLEWREVVDEVEKKDAYIADKEIYIAQLLGRLGELEERMAITERQLREAQDNWLKVRHLAAAVYRRGVRLVKLPFKFLLVWRRQGLRSAMRQAVRRIALAETDMESPVRGDATPVMIVPKPVRSERLLVICADLCANDWPTRAASLIKGATRAGYFVRWVSSTSGGEQMLPELALLETSGAGLLDEIRAGVTRVLLTDISPFALELALLAKERGAEIIFDFGSVNAETISDEQQKALESCVSRAVSFDGRANARFSAWDIDCLPAGADNEEFDSYKTYPFPEGFRKRRRNILFFAEGDMARSMLADLLAAHPHDLIHTVDPSICDNDRVRLASWDYTTRASILAAVDAVVVIGDESATHGLIETVRSALIMERPVISNVALGFESARNFHLLGKRVLAEVIQGVGPLEDFGFVSANSWLGRAEQFMRAAFPRSVSVVVLIHNNRKIIDRCISTILLHCREWLQEIVVVDNQSADGGAELVEQLYAGHPKVKLVRNSENGCSSGRNLGVKASTGEYIAFFDSDQWLTSPSCFAEAIHILEQNPRVGTIGWNAGWFDAQRADLGGAISDYVPRRGMNANALLQGYRDDVGFLGTSGMFIKRELFEKIEGFDTYYDPTCFEDTDICFQVKKAGYAVAFRDLAGIRHQPHQTTGASEGSERYKKLFNRNAEYFRKKWKDHPEFFVDYTP